MVMPETYGVLLLSKRVPDDLRAMCRDARRTSQRTQAGAAKRLHKNLSRSKSVRQTCGADDVPHPL